MYFKLLLFEYFLRLILNPIHNINLFKKNQSNNKKKLYYVLNGAS